MSKGQPIPQPVTDRLLGFFLGDVWDHSLVGFDQGLVAVCLDDDQIVLLEGREGVFQVVDFGFRGRAEFEDSHPLVGLIDEGVEYRYLRPAAIPVLPLCSHPSTYSTTRDLTFVVLAPESSRATPTVQLTASDHLEFGVRRYVFYGPGGNGGTMVLRCSLLGHDFGDPEVEREREERGSEVVVTVQEFEECTRCGERTVISENTEVTSLPDGADVGALPDDHEFKSKPEVNSEPDFEPAEPTDVETEPVETDDTEPEPVEAEDVEIIDAEEPDTGGPIDAESVDPIDTEPESTTASTDATTDETEPASESDGTEFPDDDGEILDDDSSSPTRDGNRDHGEWPDSPDVGGAADTGDELTEWPDAGTEHESADDSVVLEHDAEYVTDTPSEVQVGAEETVTADSSADAEDESATELDSGSGIERGDSAPDPTESTVTTIDDGPSEFYCPRCEYVVTDDRGSLRAGDICPDCRKGYLDERPQH